MVPPDDVFGLFPTWIAVYLLAIAAFGVAGFVLYRRVFRLILLGKDPERFDQPVRRLFGALPYVLGQRKVLQSVSLRDRAGIAHFIIFWGFLSFTTSYVLYILRRLRVERVFGDGPDRNGGEDFHRVPGCTSRRLLRGSHVGRGQALERQASQAELRPYTEDRVGPLYSCSSPA